MSIPSCTTQRPQPAPSAFRGQLAYVMRHLGPQSSTRLVLTTGSVDAEHLVGRPVTARGAAQALDHKHTQANVPNACVVHARLNIFSRPVSSLPIGARSPRRSAAHGAGQPTAAPGLGVTPGGLRSLSARVAQIRASEREALEAYASPYSCELKTRCGACLVPPSLSFDNFTCCVRPVCGTLQLFCANCAVPIIFCSADNRLCTP